MVLDTVAAVVMLMVVVVWWCQRDEGDSVAVENKSKHTSTSMITDLGPI